MTINIKALEQQAAEAEAARDAAEAHVDGLRAERDNKLTPLQKQINALQKQCDAITKAADPAISEAREALAKARTEDGRADSLLMRGYAEEALSRAPKQMTRAELIEGVNAAIGSTRTFVEGKSLGDEIVSDLVWRQNLTGGLKALDNVMIYGRTPGKTHNGSVMLTQTQAARAWAYLEKVCPKRLDGGLAPPFPLPPRRTYDND